ncbi:MAG: glycosyltransferase [Proteobacteria bacterium]|nr:glycosyltransferase [Pseudomonadota bacterium]
MTAMVPGLFSVVIPTLNEGSLLAMTTNSILAGTRGAEYEIIVVDDGSTDGSTDFYLRYPNPHVRVVRGGGLGVARARNLGAAAARGEYVVFLDGHCRVSPNWLARFAEALSVPDVAVVGPTFTKLAQPTPRGCGMFWADWALSQHWFEPLDREPPYQVPLTTGACQAFRRDVFMAIGQYDDGFTRWGSEDVEICLRAWLLGYRVAVDPAVTVAHHFRESRAYEVDDVEITFNFLRMLHMHFSAPRIARVIARLGNNPFVAPALEMIEASDVFAVRAELDASRTRDDGWFFAHVNTALREAA